MAFIHSSNVVQCPTCKNTKVTASHRDIISPLDIPTCAKCKEKMNFLKKAELIDWLTHPKDLLNNPRDFLKYFQK
ncbi:MULTISPECIES: hypothetical protein [Acinetobacter]|jgi:NAD-dependent SIR2 family protein deacetylase|uniref:hypothetical protein n=1 Tax=Acinetobacter TaxID=469 RepID=UPI000F7ECF16|nr:MULTISPECIES: hypothetical protein [Acinetobacter]RTE44732.1 hypothetical protein EJJ36_15235 [Acinetobacter junii]